MQKTDLQFAPSLALVTADTVHNSSDVEETQAEFLLQVEDLATRVVEELGLIKDVVVLPVGNNKKNKLNNPIGRMVVTQWKSRATLTEKAAINWQKKQKKAAIRVLTINQEVVPQN